MPAIFTIEHMKEVAAIYGGKCLSKEYVNNSVPLEWMCKKGHTWDRSYSIVQQGLWCSQCLKNEDWLDRLIEIAEEKGGKCLSDTYTNTMAKYKFRCKKGHTFILSGQSAKNGNWCRICTKEEKKLIQIRRIEAYAKKKGGICNASSYKSKLTSLKWQCSQGHVWKSKADRMVNKKYWCPHCKRVEICEKELLKLKRIAEKQNGYCLSSSFSRIDVKLQWRCKEGHVFWLIPKKVKQGKWCAICTLKAGNEKRKIPLTVLRNHAKKRGGKLLSTIYGNALTMLEWQCDNGHKWQASASSVYHMNHWCRKCHFEERKSSIEGFRKIASKNGGRLLSGKYVDSKTKLKWQCKESHVWFALPYDIRKGKWCPVCLKYSRRKKQPNKIRH